MPESLLGPCRDYQGIYSSQGLQEVRTAMSSRKAKKRRHKEVKQLAQASQVSHRTAFPSHILNPGLTLPLLVQERSEHTHPQLSPLQDLSTVLSSVQKK